MEHTLHELAGPVPSSRFDVGSAISTEGLRDLRPRLIENSQNRIRLGLGQGQCRAQAEGIVEPAE